MNTEKLVLGTLAGLAAGAILGILMAPDKGSETRRKIREGSMDAVDSLKDKVDSMLEAVELKIETVKDDITHLYKKAEIKEAPHASKA